MRAPPAVALPLEMDVAWRAMQAVLCALAAGCLTMWLAQRAQLGFALAMGLLAVCGLLAAAVGWRIAWRPASQLMWTGTQWQWPVAGSEHALLAAPQVMLDLGSWMLLRLNVDPAGTRRWVTARPLGDAARWTAFRAAVYSPASRPLGPSAAERPGS